MDHIYVLYICEHVEFCKAVYAYTHIHVHCVVLSEEHCAFLRYINEIKSVTEKTAHLILSLLYELNTT